MSAQALAEIHPDRLYSQMEVAPVLRRSIAWMERSRRDGVHCHLEGTDIARAGVPTEKHVHNVHQVHAADVLEL